MTPQKVREFISREKLIEKYDKILIGISAGPDSVALLNILEEFKEEYKIKLFLVHINYLLRGRESLEDEEFIKAVGKDKEIPIFIRRSVIIRNKSFSIQKEARKIRYDFFLEVARSIGAKKIALGHVYEDHIETIFMRLITGTGAEGLKGIKAKRKIDKDIEVIRPILCLKKKEVENYLREKNISFRVDFTNLEPKYKRNRIRLEIFPKIEVLNPKFKENLERISFLWGEDDKFLKEISEDYRKKLTLKEDNEEIVLDGESLDDLTFPLKSRIIKEVIQRLIKDIQKVNYGHIQKIINLCNRRANKSIYLPNLEVYKNYNELIFTKKKNKKFPEYEYKVLELEEIYLKEIGARFSFRLDSLLQNEEIGKNRLEIILDYDKIKMPLWIRNRRKGDRFTPLGLNGRKKLKDLFIDRKIPLRERDRIPIVLDREKILWIVGIEISDLIKVDKDTKRILRIKCEYI
jgi:tRNA(Ile)-lysidine synthase